MTAYRSIEDLPSRYRFVHIAARRARKIQNGARPLITVASKKPTRIAEQEVMAGLVAYTAPPVPGQEEGEPAAD